MTAQTAAKRITRRLGGIESETLADIQQAIDEAVKEERARYVKLADSWGKTEGYDSIGWRMCAAELKALIQPISLTGGSP